MSALRPGDRRGSVIVVRAGQVGGEAQRSFEQMPALYNYKMFLEDRSHGVHNAACTIQVLYDSLKALDPSLDDALRPQ